MLVVLWRIHSRSALPYATWVSHEACSLVNAILMHPQQHVHYAKCMQFSIHSHAE